MSGHSKWSQIKRAKGAADSKKGAAFTRIARLITLAAREGGDVTMNFKLRLALDKAKEVNMPKDTIDRAIKRGTGELNDGTQLEEITYEGYGPGSVPIIVETITDNRNRTASDVRHLFSSLGGKQGELGSVQWMFDKRGVIYLDRPETSDARDALELAAIDAGAEDVKDRGDHFEVITLPENIDAAKQALGSLATIAESGIELVAKTPMSLSGEPQEKLHHLIEALEEHEDVKAVFTAEA